ncbi:MAG: hypothetical protein MJ071_07490 [Oscillospiraceae bacterium]|nr:hypothetical protein [Oscillospiraceae bacterium]
MSELNEWQINLLEAEGLPTEYDQLSSTQQHTITRVWEMISYLNEKYEQEFIYVDYIPKDLNQSETLIAYPRSTGYGNGKYAVTVKTKGDTFTDDFHDFSVADLAETLTNAFLTEQFGDSYKFISSPLACDITMGEVIDEKFQWKFGAENGIFLLEELCSFDRLEEFAVKYAKFLYEHELSGRHRIEVLKEMPKDPGVWSNYGSDIYGNRGGYSLGFYTLYCNPYRVDDENGAYHCFPPTVYRTDWIKYRANPERPWLVESDISATYSVEEYLAKYE